MNSPKPLINCSLILSKQIHLNKERPEVEEFIDYEILIVLFHDNFKKQRERPML